MGRSSKVARCATVCALAAGMLGSSGKPAWAYSQANCLAGPIEDVDTLRISAGEADFGDDLHLGGAPQGTAAVCWYRGGDRALDLFGKLYVDSFHFSKCVTARIEHIGTHTTVRSERLCSDGPSSRRIEYGIQHPGDARQVRVRLFLGSRSNNPGQLVATRTSFRGD